MRPTRGMTLIELMVVLALVALLLLAAAPGVGSWLRNSEIRNAAQGIVNALQQARSEAIRRNRDVWFSLVTPSAASSAVLDNTCALSSASASWVVSLASPEGACAQAAGASSTPFVIDKQAQGAGSPHAVVTVRGSDCSGTDSAAQVIFNGYGRPTAPASGRSLRCLDVSHSSTDADQRPLRVMIGAAGSMRLCDPAVTDGSDPRHC